MFHSRANLCRTSEKIICTGAKTVAKSFPLRPRRPKNNKWGFFPRVYVHEEGFIGKGLTVCDKGPVIDVMTLILTLISFIYVPEKVWLMVFEKKVLRDLPGLVTWVR